MRSISISGVLNIGLLLVTLILIGCRSSDYRPDNPHRVSDIWQVNVRLDGLVMISRQVELDEESSLYLAGVAGLGQTQLFGSLDRQEQNECSLVNENPVILNCSTVYRLIGMPSQAEAIVPLPADMLPSFLIEQLGYQPLDLTINQQVVASVPGRILDTPDDQTTYYPVYAWRSIKMEDKRQSTLEWYSETVLAPGDLAHAGLKQMEALVFQPVVGK